MFRKTIGPLLIMTLSPLALLCFWYINLFCSGSFFKFFFFVKEMGIFSALYTMIASSLVGWRTALGILTIFSALQLILMRIPIGKIYDGPITPQGNTPKYRNNGLFAYLVTIALFALGSSTKLFNATIFYDYLGPMLTLLSLFAFAFCLFLYVKALYFPSTNDIVRSGNPVFDYYWGMELYPRILGFDVKQFTNCRFGMMIWPLIIASFLAKQIELFGLTNTMLISVALQAIYITKFFVWESGYMRSLDIMHDRAGFYICWGCLSWVPGFYTLSTLFLVHHPVMLATLPALAIALLGLFFLIVAFAANWQRKKVRIHQGQCSVWGKPAKIIEASYTTQNGEKKKNILLYSGWWGISRHFHYFPEIMGSLMWAIPIYPYIMPYLYTIFLTALLCERAERDHKRCAKKYGEDWDKYCEKVPYKIIPYLF